MATRLSKPYGELAIRLMPKTQARKKETDTTEMLKLSPREYGELVLEGFITLTIVFILYLGVWFILDTMLDSPFLLQTSSDSLRETWNIQPESVEFYKTIYTWLVAAFAIAFTYWRLIRRYRQMQLYHVLDELHKIANGNYPMRIPFHLGGDMGKVVTSINRLVDSTVAAMEEERRIEKSKDELITNVSHDIRTPLTSIIGYLGLVTNGPYQVDDDAKRYATIAFNKAQQMKTLVDNLFEYTTMRPNGVPLRLSEIPIGNFLEQIAANFELEAQKKEMTIEVQPIDPNIILEIDAEKMVRVINNLLSNAIKYGQKGRNISIEAQEEEGIIKINVSNYGDTIPPEVLRRLFHRFYRLEESRSKETGGTGLGLAISENIVRMHGGIIYAESQDGLTSFIVCLPSDNHLAIPAKK